MEINKQQRRMISKVIRETIQKEYLNFIQKKIQIKIKIQINKLIIIKKKTSKINYFFNKFALKIIMAMRIICPSIIIINRKFLINNKRQ